MTSSKNNTRQAEKLRKRAEESIEKKGSNATQNLDNLSPEEAKALLHELLGHQIELEMQNDELYNTRKELEISRSRYFDLFNLTPVGYVTLSENGLIHKAI
jgi:hypothetical protein